jgi:YesN/AraC family two-component response regulator
MMKKWLEKIIARFITSNTDIVIVSEFSNALQAIKYLNQNKVDLIFLDIHMPDFTGFRSNYKKSNQKSDQIQIEIFFEEMYCRFILVKPINADRFLKQLKSSLKKTRSKRI